MSTPTSDLDTTLTSQLDETFGFPAFRPGQLDVCRSLVEGHSAAAVFPTGGGKSLCYQLPALVLEGTTVVVSPLIALMKDQIDALAARGVAAARIDSSLTLEELREVSRQVRCGELKLLYVAPERFTNERFRALLADTQVSLFAVDEAHCISEWGHNFRPDYLKLAKFARDAEAQCILALTATATPAVLEDIQRFFEIDPDHSVRTPFHRPNLILTAQRETEETRLDALKEWLTKRPEGGASIIYVTLQRTAMEIAAQLNEAGFEARPYHAGLDTDVRAETQEWFLESTSGIVVATIAFGMGIDKPNIRAVAHYNLPKSLENYAQEIGRAGRDGNDSLCTTFLVDADRRPLENFALGDLPDRSGIETLVETMLIDDDEAELSVSLSRLSGQTDIRPLVLRTLLTYLEIDGYLEELTPIYEKVQFAPMVESAEILGHFEGAEHRFVHNVLAHSQQARKWFTLDVDAAARYTGRSRRDVMTLLEELADREFLELKPSGLVHRFRRLTDAESVDLAALTDDLSRRMEERCQRDIGRIDGVVQFLESDRCLSDRLGEHFGETLETPCGRCAVCTGEMIEPSAEKPEEVEVDQEILERAAALRAAPKGDVFESPLALARFLCGITSPKLTRGRWTRHEDFGIAEELPFEVVRARVEEL